MAQEYLTAYWLDKNDVIERVSLFWDEFAEANDGKDAVSAKICGKPIWEFIQDEPTTTWLKIFFENVRKRQAPLERGYRCDSPFERRHMLMRITPMHAGGLFVENILLRAEPRRHPVFFTPTVSQKEGADKILRCSVCGRVKKRHVWEEADSEAPLTPLNVEYTVCERCG